MIKKALFFGALIVALWGCKKSEDFVNPVYMCECGELTWGGETYPLLLAEYVTLADSLPLSRRYYLTTDVRLEGEDESHNLNFTLELDSVNHPVFFVPNDTVPNLLEEVNFNDDILPYRTFTTVNGVVEVNGAPLGGTETVSMEMLLKEVVNGDTVGFEIPFTGSFSVTIE